MDLPLSPLDKKSSDFLDSISVASIKRGERELITLSPNETVEQVIEKLAIHNISSAPIFDGYKQNIVGSISVLDLAFWIVRTFSEAKGDRPKYDWKTVDREFRTPVRDIAEFAVDPFWPVPEELSLKSLVSSYFKWRIHRSPVTAHKKISGHVSQSDVVSFLAGHLHEMGTIVDKTLVDLELHSGPVLSILKGKSLIDAFSTIVENKFTGLAVIDEEGKLVNHFSASDLKGLTKDTFWKLELPLEKMFEGQKKLPPLQCRPEATFGEVIKKLSDCRVHRIYVVDEENRPVNVITLTTIMRVLSPLDSGCFA